MVATAAAAGSVYAVIGAPPNFSWIGEVATGATIGAVISFCIIGFELFGEAWMFERGGGRLPLGAAILWRTIGYGVVIMAALLVVPWVYAGATLSPFRPGIVGDLVFSIVATLMFVSLTSIAQLIGPNVRRGRGRRPLRSIGLGRGRRPPNQMRRSETNAGKQKRAVACPSGSLRKNRVAHALGLRHMLPDTSGMEVGR
jgi:hypothetical protein